MAGGIIDKAKAAFAGQPDGPKTHAGIPETILREMLGGDLVDAMVASQARTKDDTIMVRIHEGLCLIEKGGEIIAERLGHDAAVDALNGLS